MTVLKLVKFIWPLMLILGIQRISRPVVNLLVARSAQSHCESVEVNNVLHCSCLVTLYVVMILLKKSIAVLTTTYPLGHLPYGWLNQLRTISPAFRQVRTVWHCMYYDTPKTAGIRMYACHKIIVNDLITFIKLIIIINFSCTRHINAIYFHIIIYYSLYAIKLLIQVICTLMSCWVRRFTGSYFFLCAQVNKNRRRLVSGKLIGTFSVCCLIVSLSVC